MRYRSSDASPTDSVVHARQAYRSILARRGLTNFSPTEVASAQSMLQDQGYVRVDSEDIAFQAAITRLQCRKSLPPQTLENTFKELLEAEYECDQAEYERDCHRAADAEHSPFGPHTKKAEA